MHILFGVVNSDSKWLDNKTTRIDFAINRGQGCIGMGRPNFVLILVVFFIRSSKYPFQAMTEDSCIISVQFEFTKPSSC